MNQPVIRQLSQSLINKIAAGEVIERPASVVKELLENSVDAGSTSVELTIEGGGIELIRISDNGCGITEEQLPLAVASHATSKLESADDLFDVHTLGFRGEALASIGEVSHLTIRSRAKVAEAGAEMSVRGGESTAIVPCGHPIGTTIEVRHLFFNTPVRRKFMRTAQTEASHITEAFTRIALANPGVQMKMTSGKRVVYDLPATESWKERIREFFGNEIADSLIAVESEQETAKLFGYVADPSVSRSNNRMQYLFLNGRHIRDKSLQHALGEAYRGLLMVGRFPVCFLRLELPAEQVDVNVHPTKMEVRFQESGKVYSQLLKTLRHEFLTSDLTARAKHVPGPLPSGLRPESSPANRGENPAHTSAVEGASPLPRKLGDDVHSNSGSEDRWQAHAERMTRVDPANTLGLSSNIPEFRPFPASKLDPLGGSQAADMELPPGAEQWNAEEWQASGEATQGGKPDGGQDSSNVASQFGAPATDGEIIRADQAHSPQEQQASHLGFQVHNRYLITQDDSGMVVVDQHALHERILYEQLREKTEQRSLESQKLLVPEPLDLTPSEAAAAMEHRELLLRIGIEIEPFGGDTVLMTSYPAMLAKMRPAEVLRQVLDPLMSGGKEPSARDLLDELLHMFACKAAIKAGDKLSVDEITSLLEQRDHYQDTHHCPHGRPTALFFSRDQLDKMFGRT